MHATVHHYVRYRMFEDRGNKCANQTPLCGFSDNGGLGVGHTMSYKPSQRKTDFSLPDFTFFFLSNSSSFSVPLFTVEHFLQLHLSLLAPEPYGNAHSVLLQLSLYPHPCLSSPLTISHNISLFPFSPQVGSGRWNILKVRARPQPLGGTKSAGEISFPSFFYVQL